MGANASTDAEPAARPSGDFVIIDIRRAGDVAGPLVDDSLTWELGQTLSLQEELTLPDGKSCNSWNVLEEERPVVNLDDPVLSDTQLGPVDGPGSQGDKRINHALALYCVAGKPVLKLLQVDQRVLLASSPSGQSYAVLEKPLDSEQLMGFQSQLRSMKFMQEEASGRWTEHTRIAVSGYSDYRGAEFNFYRAAITENLLDGLGLLSGTGVLKVLYSGDIAAYFYGEPVELAPPEYGTRQLKFRFQGDNREYAFVPKGELFGSDWTLEMISPDGQHIALLQGHYGPYHVLPVAHLKAYLNGQREPDWVVEKPRASGPNHIAGVHSDLKWTSTVSLEFTHSCCGDPIGQYWQIPDSQYPLPCDRDIVRLYRSELSPQIDQLPTLLQGLAREGWDSDVQTVDLPAAFIRLSEVNLAANQSPGKWVEGPVELGAELHQYYPSNEELLACIAGRELLALLDRKTYSVVAFNWKDQAGLPPAVEFKNMNFRRVEVQGSGLYHFPSPPEPVAFGPWNHGLLPPGLRALRNQ